MCIRDSFFTAHLLDESPYNAGHYHSDKVEGLVGELRNEFDPEKRAQLAIEIQQQVLDDKMCIRDSHIRIAPKKKTELMEPVFWRIINGRKV